MPALVRIKAGDTEPLELTIGATGVSTLANLTAATFYARKEGSSTNHVDGGTMSVESSALRTVAFDPLNQKNGGGNAFDVAGVYNCYVKAEWDDGDFTRHPGEDHVVVVVEASFE